MKRTKKTKDDGTILDRGLDVLCRYLSSRLAGDEEFLSSIRATAEPGGIEDRIFQWADRMIRGDYTLGGTPPNTNEDGMVLAAAMLGRIIEMRKVWLPFVIERDRAWDEARRRAVQKTTQRKHKRVFDAYKALPKELKKHRSDALEAVQTALMSAALPPEDRLEYSTTHLRRILFRKKTSSHDGTIL
jgi:hypothetical protein